MYAIRASYLVPKRIVAERLDAVAAIVRKSALVTQVSASTLSKWIGDPRLVPVLDVAHPKQNVLNAFYETASKSIQFTPKFSYKYHERIYRT
jgi:hypothetical protein